MGIGTVQLCLGSTPVVKFGYPVLSPFAKLVQQPELDGLSRARFGAGRREAITQAVVAESALVGAPIRLASVDHAERARRHAIAATVADIVLHHHRAELGPHKRPGGADVKAARMSAVLAHVAGHQPLQFRRSLAVSRRPPPSWAVGATASGRACSMNATCRHVEALRPPVLSYDMPVRRSPSSGTAFHSLQATSQALQPMHTEVSVKKPTLGG